MHQVYDHDTLEIDHRLRGILRSAGVSGLWCTRSALRKCRQISNETCKGEEKIYILRIFEATFTERGFHIHHPLGLAGAIPTSPSLSPMASDTGSPTVAAPDEPAPSTRLGHVARWCIKEASGKLMSCSLNWAVEPFHYQKLSWGQSKNHAV